MYNFLHPIRNFPYYYLIKVFHQKVLVVRMLDAYCLCLEFGNNKFGGMWLRKSLTLLKLKEGYSKRTCS